MPSENRVGLEGFQQFEENREDPQEPVNLNGVLAKARANVERSMQVELISVISVRECRSRTSYRNSVPS